MKLAFASFFLLNTCFKECMKLSQIKIAQLINEADEELGDLDSASSTDDGGDGETLVSLWDQNSDSSSSYRPIQNFSVKQVGDEYEVSTVVNDKRTVQEKISKDELDKTYVVSADGKPDAEGYVAYTLRETVEAFQYQGDSKIVNNGEDHATLMKGDYLVKKPEGDSFKYMVVHQAEFESKYSEIV